MSEINARKPQMFEMQLEIDILKETINVLKSDPGVKKVPYDKTEAKIQLLQGEPIS